MKLIFSILLAVAGGLGGYTVYAKFFSNSSKSGSTSMNNADGDETAWIGLPETYLSLSANKKSELLWNRITDSIYGSSNGTSAHRPTWDEAAGLKQLFKTGFLDLKPAFTCNLKNSDILPFQRKRGIHNLGVVGLVQFSMDASNTKNNFTGLLAPGSVAQGIVRMSLAAPPAGAGYLPGIGLKLLIDGEPSVNTVANHDLDGQEQNTNFFANFLRTTLPTPTKLKPKILGARFEMVESPATSLPVRDLALFKANGEKIMSIGTYPYMLKFMPTEAVRNNAALTNSQSTNDFRDDLINNLKPNTPLYDVYAANGLTEEDDKNAFKIGVLTLTSNVVAAEFGDARLCFKHQRNNPKWDEIGKRY